MLALPESDLKDIVREAKHWQQLCGGHLLLTGGTGFVGKWLLGSFLTANRELNLQAKITVLTRDPGAFLARWPELGKEKNLYWLRGDIKSFVFPSSELSFTHVIHAAALVSPNVDSHAIWDNLVLGIDNLLTQLGRCQEVLKSRPKLLIISSGAVYGQRSGDNQPCSEFLLTCPDSMQISSAYGLGKRVSEYKAMLFSSKTQWLCTVARLFAVLGPHLPLDGSFAAGSFLKNACSGEAITIKGDGKATRSYLYASDMASWLWSILFNGQNCSAYNVGSTTAISMAKFAQTVADCAVTHNGGQKVEVKILDQATDSLGPRFYLPDTTKAQGELDLRQYTKLEDAILKTINWIKKQSEGKNDFY